MLVLKMRARARSSRASTRSASSRVRGRPPHVVSCLRWIGMVSDEGVEVRGGNLFDMPCARLVWLMQYEAGERDLVWEDGSEVRAPRSQFKKIISMMSFTANAHVHTGSVRRPHRALRDGAHRGPAVRHHHPAVIDGVLGVYALYAQDNVDLFGRCWRDLGWGLLSGCFKMFWV